MAFIFAHPVAGFSDQDDALKAGFTTVTNDYLVSGGRFGDGAFRNSNSSNSLRKPVTSSGKIIVHFTIKWPTISGVESPFLQLHNNSGADRCLELKVTPSGGIRLEDATSTPVVVSSAGTVVSNIHHVVVCEAQIGSAAGTVRVWVDDMTTPVIDETGVDLDDGAGGACDLVQWLIGVGSWELSQIFIYDTSGVAPWNANIGDKRLYPLLPDGDDTQGWTRSAGANNFDLVDDPLNAVSDEDGTYVEASAAATLDQYTFEDLPVDASGVISVIANVEAKKTDAGAEPGNLTIRIASGMNTSDSASLSPLTTGYLEYQAEFDDVPGGSGWTPSQVNGLLAGPRIP